jgi:hypothetical protein
MENIVQENKNEKEPHETNEYRRISGESRASRNPI